MHDLVVVNVENKLKKIYSYVRDEDYNKHKTKVKAFFLFCSLNTAGRKSDYIAFDRSGKNEILI